MSNRIRPVQWLSWGVLLAVILGVLVAFVLELRRTSKAEPELPVYLQVADFSLTNQLGGATSLGSLRGQVWVANIIFTRCPGPCARMTKQMARLQALLPADAPIKLVSLTTDPEFDTPQVLGDYGRMYGADFARWWFLTGTKDELRRLAVNSLGLTTIEKEAASRSSPDDLFIHSTISVLVDQSGRVRATYQVLPPDGVDAEGEVEAYQTDMVRRMAEQAVRLAADPQRQ